MYFSLYMNAKGFAKSKFSYLKNVSDLAFPYYMLLGLVQAFFKK